MPFIAEKCQQSYCTECFWLQRERHRAIVAFKAQWRKIPSNDASSRHAKGGRQSQQHAARQGLPRLTTLKYHHESPPTPDARHSIDAHQTASRDHIIPRSSERDSHGDDYALRLAATNARHDSTDAAALATTPIATRYRPYHRRRRKSASARQHFSFTLTAMLLPPRSRAPSAFSMPCFSRDRRAAFDDDGHDAFGMPRSAIGFIKKMLI